MTLQKANFSRARRWQQSQMLTISTKSTKRINEFIERQFFTSTRQLFAMDNDLLESEMCTCNSRSIELEIESSHGA